MRLTGVIDTLTRDPLRARVSVSARGLHVNTAAAEEVRSTLRPFVRDGFIAEASLRSDPMLVPPSVDGSCGSSHPCAAEPP